MDRARQDLLADARLAQDQHADIAPGGALSQRLHAPHALLDAEDGIGGVEAAPIRVARRPTRAGARAGQQRRRVAAVDRVAGDPDRPLAAQPLRERGDQGAGDVAGQPGQQQLAFTRPEQADDVDRSKPGGVRRSGRRNGQARDGERATGRFGARALPLDPPFELGVRYRLPATVRRRSVGLHHQDQRADRYRFASEDRDARLRRQLAPVDARAVRAAEIFDRNLAAITDLKSQVAARRLRVVELHVDPGGVAAPDDDLAARGQREPRELLRSHHQQMQTPTTALTARQRRLVPQRGRGRHDRILALVVRSGW